MPGLERAAQRLTRSAVLLLGFGAMSTAAAAQVPPRLEARIERGRALASANCSSCHSVGPSGASANRRAPPFRALSGQYVELTLHQKLTEIAETGHYDMPPVPVHTDEVGAIVTYINSLAQPGEPPTAPARPRLRP